MEDAVRDFELEVISQPEEGTATILVFKKKGKHAFFKGVGEVNYLCGACGNVLCQGTERGQIIGIVFKCPNCDSFNYVKGT